MFPIDLNLEWHKLSKEKVVYSLRSSLKSGLDEQDILERRKTFGVNSFSQQKKTTFWDMLLNQFKSPLILVLVFAGFLMLFLKEFPDATVIFIIVVVNSVIGIFQEGRASKAFEKLLASQKQFTTVLRNGQRELIEVALLVPGDIVFLKSGDFVPADARILEANDLSANESILTGEWASVSKDDKEILRPAYSAGRFLKTNRPTDQENVVFMGTHIVSGNCTAIVIKTGDKTEMGKIAGLLALNTARRSKPFEKGVKKIAKVLTIGIVVAVVIVFSVGLLTGEDPKEMFLLAVAISVAAIPSGLPIAITVILAVALEKILRRGGLIKNLNATETLGSTTIIITDKTGTLTEAKMKVADILTLNKDSSFNTKILSDAVLTADVFLEKHELKEGSFKKTVNTDSENENDHEWIVRGRPVEKAIYWAAMGLGIKREELVLKMPQLDFVPFKSEERYSASLNRLETGNRLFVLAAPEVIMENSKHCLIDGAVSLFTDELKAKINFRYQKDASSGMRFVALAYKNSDKKHFSEFKEEEILSELVFEGIIGLHDPIREGVADSIKRIKEGGVKVLMATGDHANTAVKVAKDVGIFKEGEMVLTGEQIEEFDDAKLLEALKTTTVFARMLPEQKLKLLKLLKKQDEVVAMTGDGVNDAPALKIADIGLALGDGTDIAKEASEIILLDNSFDIIVYAVEEGRHILDNLRKTLAYLLSTAFSEIILVGTAFSVGLFSGSVSILPILPIQILWANFVEEGLMSFAFAFEPREDDLLKRNPKTDNTKNILDKSLMTAVALIAFLVGLSLVVLYFYLSYLKLPVEEIRTIMFIVVSIDSILYSFSLRNLKYPFWKVNFFSNKYLLGAVAISTLALLLALFVPALANLLSIVPVTAFEIFLLAILGVFNVMMIEVVKYFVLVKRNRTIGI